MGISVAFLVTVPAYIAAGVALVMGAGWLIALAIVFGATAIAGAAAAAWLLRAPRSQPRTRWEAEPHSS